MLLWTVVIPVKRLAVAKSRLADPARNRDLALAFAQDTVRAAATAAGVARVLVVTGDDEVARAVAGSGAVVRPDVLIGGLNAALRSAA
ncbi:MAG: 2-phospho-L-lactate guanylyltransferase, partial [Actinomycetota bacterium]|nr:2-phospho-L-lactate guanylyltransferase [Actinomycetota bacterium]